MSLWVDTLRILVSDVLRSFGPGSGVKIQIRDRDGLWRDHSQSSGNSESIQETLRAPNQPPADRSEPSMPPDGSWISAD